MPAWEIICIADGDCGFIVTDTAIFITRISYNEGLRHIAQARYVTLHVTRRAVRGTSRANVWQWFKAHRIPVGRLVSNMAAAGDAPAIDVICAAHLICTALAVIERFLIICNENSYVRAL